MRVLSSGRISAVCCLVALLLTAVADAQPPGGGRGGQRGGGQRQRGQRGGFGGGLGMPQIDRATLLRSDDVKEELGVDEGQAATIQAALQAFREEAGGERPDFSAFRDMSDDERRAAFEKMQKDREEQSKKRDDVLAALLKPEQIERIDQIALQANLNASLVATLKSDSVKQQLSITEEQVQKLDTVDEAGNERRREEFSSLFGGGGERPSREEMQKQMDKLNKQTEKEAMAVLTEDQQKKLTELKGGKFEVNMRELMGGGRGGFGGGGGRRGEGGGGGEGGGRGDGGGRRGRPPADDDAI